MEVFIFAVLLGLIPAAIASKKGRSFALWWFFGAGLFIAALPMAILMKSKGQQAQGGESSLRKCPKCAELIQPDASLCKHCHADVVPLTNDEQKILAKKTKESNHVPGWLTAVVFIAVGAIIWSMVNSGGSSTDTNVASAPSQKSPKEEALTALEIKKLNWHKGGFDSIMLIDAKLQNNGKRDIKDVELECTHFSNSGTRIDSNKKTIYEIIRAGQALNVKEFSMGFIHNQAATTSCEITNAVLM